MNTFEIVFIIVAVLYSYWYYFL